MSLVVEHLSKIYKTQKAVDDISFEAKEGQILGFLGPNGAGKSTTMKIVTGFINQTSGKVFVCGKDTQLFRNDTKKVIGYLPEHNPLYLELYVREYLSFCASISGIDNKTEKVRIDEMIQKTGLSPEKSKKIGQLSKGYRQRVGLAASLLHDPKVLILDEPTTGLDPNQIVEIRNLIKEIALEKTVVLSTHLMQEVQELCNQVVIINKGKIVADDNIENLRKLSGNGLNTVICDFGIDVQLSEALSAFYTEVKSLSPGKFKFITKNDQILKNQIFKFAGENNLSLVSLQTENVGLEEVFRNITNN
ncbi:MAG: gliding motility-associated ABC transporter ATP-binding subunit GldA [Cytophagales bacterium]